MAQDAKVSSEHTDAVDPLPTGNVASAVPAGVEETLPEPGTVAPVWLQRMSLCVLVLFCVYLGVLLMVLPWWRRGWDENMFIQSRPALAALLRNGAMKGLVSGLGILDVWIGISEAVHYRDHRA